MDLILPDYYVVYGLKNFLDFTMKKKVLRNSLLTISNENDILWFVRREREIDDFVRFICFSSLLTWMKTTNPV